MFDFFKKKKPVKTVEDPTRIIKRIPISHGEIVMKFDRITGRMKLIDVTSPLIMANSYEYRYGSIGKVTQRTFPAAWSAKKSDDIFIEFTDIIMANLPYENRKEYEHAIELLFKMFWQFEYHNGDYIELFGNYLATDFQLKKHALSIFLESTIQWLKFREEQFDSLHSEEPELKLTDEEYERILKSMKRFQ